MRLNLFLLAGVVLLVSVAGCGGGGDLDDAIKANGRFIDAMERYLNDLDQADSADVVAEAIDAYAREIEKIAPELKAIAASHPEWKDVEKIPEKLKPIQEKAQAVAAQMPASFMKIMKYMGDENVRQAQKRLQEAMSRMNPNVE